MVLIKDLPVVTIPQQLIDANARFVLVKPKNKKAFEKGWDVGSNYAYGDNELMEHLQNHGNYGVLSWNGVCVFDIDYPEKAVGTDFKLPKTLTIRRSAPSGDHHHVYFFCPDCPEEHRRKHILTFGDIRLGGNSYVVGPNCHHPDGVDYEIQFDYPIATIGWDLISKILEKFEIESDTQNLPPASRNSYAPVGDWSELLGLRCIDILPPKGKVSTIGDIVKGDHPLHGSKNGQNYHINTRTNEWKCWRCDHGGNAISLYAMKKGLITCEGYSHGCLIGKGEQLILALDKDGYDVTKLGTYAKIVLLEKHTRELLKEWGI